jgi:DeoR family ulaG and ulaABCDEF operon transcriptional repressor
MHEAEREQEILGFLNQSGFISFQELERRMDASAATIRRDLARMMDAGLITRVHGGAKLAKGGRDAAMSAAEIHNAPLTGVPFLENINRNRLQKKAIGMAAAGLCVENEGVMIDGGSTTLQMCPHLNGMNLQVLTNSLHIINALLPQVGTKLLIPGGQVFREQNIVLSAAGDETMPRFHAPKLFMGATSVGSVGVMQADILLVAAERRLVDRASEIIVLVDSSKFSGPSGHVVCPLEEVDVIVTDSGIAPRHVKMLEKVGVKLVIAKV